MRIDATSCNGCQECIAYCPVRAIVPHGDGVCVIDRDGCVECGVCRRAAPCPTDAFVAEELPWPRSLRALFSDPTLEHGATHVPGRGTEEMKTNDVTGRYRPGDVGLVLELGRPGVGARLGDVEPLIGALADLGVALEPANPLTRLVVDAARGLLDPRVRGERVLSAVIECAAPVARLREVLERLRSVAAALPTVVSVGLTTVTQDDVDPAVGTVLGALDLPLSSAGKVNVGLGRSSPEGL